MPTCSASPQQARLPEPFPCKRNFNVLFTSCSVSIGSGLFVDLFGVKARRRVEGEFCHLINVNHGNFFTDRVIVTMLAFKECGKTTMNWNVCLPFHC